jgi:CO dehydrogenase/acetyl-CoA synthase alpha subunit
VICDALAAWLECKVGACPNLWGAMEQAAKAATPGLAPIVIAHRDRGRSVVVMELDDWLEWVRERVQI